ncbi:acyl-CoA thioesterase [Bradyrhizobium sp. U531]|uniref:acyl-CoA thioesterase n=1 Tax=Bradyrhizobium sp. U531 TaxID=3053458 RepID=UPI003F68950E
MHFDEGIDVCVRVAKIGRSSITLLLAIFAKGSDDLRATGEIIWVATDRKTHQSVAVEESLRALIASREKGAGAGIEVFGCPPKYFRERSGNDHRYPNARADRGSIRCRPTSD